MKQLKILRGCSGSGKSTKARELVAEAHSKGLACSICSTDEFFVTSSGKYEFDAKRLTEAHAWNKGRVYQAMYLGVDLIVLDNTNTQKWEYAPYINMAESEGYEVEEIIVGDFKDDILKVYANRNKHNVSLDIIRRQAKRFER